MNLATRLLRKTSSKFIMFLFFQDLTSFPSTASTSQEDHESNSESISVRTLRVTLLSSEWRSTKGGLSTINRELAIQLAKHPSVEVSVYLPQCSDCLLYTSDAADE